VPDLPGFGRSPRLSKPSIAGMAQALARLLDELDVREPAVVAGLSMGGYVALEFWRRYPERVRGLGLLSTRAGADSPKQRRTRAQVARDVRAHGLAPLARSMGPKLLSPATLRRRPGVVRALRRMILSNRKGGVADALQAMAGRRDSMPLLGRIRVPALIVAGADDVVIPASEARLMRRAIRGAVLNVLPNAGHLLNLERPADVNRLLGRLANRSGG
jgi:3-oxoadipate enol-lactonase